MGTNPNQTLLGLIQVLLGDWHQAIQRQNAFQHGLHNLAEDVRKYLGAALFAILAALQVMYLLASPFLGDLPSHI